MKTKAGTDWQPTDEQILSWQHAFPEVDIFAELNVMATWLEANPARVKTVKGMPRFCQSWLSRANQKGGSPFAQHEQEQTGKIPMKQWTQLDDLTNDFCQSEAFRQSCLNKYGQYMSYEGVRVTR